jgi:hypothetical protein
MSLPDVVPTADGEGTWHHSPATDRVNRPAALGVDNPESRALGNHE